jgi:uncharacterized membrane protein YcaP (DUF421 family)
MEAFCESVRPSELSCKSMEANTIHALLNIALLQAITFLFVYIRYYFSPVINKTKGKLEEKEIAICIVSGFLVFFVIVSESTSLTMKYLFFILSICIYAGSCVLILRHQKAKPMIYPKSFLIFHNGSFLKGAILQNKLSEKEILKSLNMKGVQDLTEVDTIILEPDGELSVIFKKKAKSA